MFSFPLLGRTLSWAVLSLLSASLFFTPLTAHAAHWVVAYNTNGTDTGLDGATNLPYTRAWPVAGPNGGGAAPSSYQSTWETSQGTVTPTLTWTADSGDTTLPPAPDPAQAVIYVSISASIDGNNGRGTSPQHTSASDSFGDSFPTTISGTVQTTSGAFCHLATMSNSGGSTQVPLPAIALNAACSTDGSNQGGTTILNVVTTPLNIVLTGVTVDSGKNNILVGQGCTAGWFIGQGQRIYATLSDWHWTVSASDNTFQSWNGNSGRLPVAAVLGPGLLTNPIAHWYRSDLTQMSETVSCTATCTPPPGTGSPFPVTSTQKVIVQVPTLTASGTGSYMQVNKKAPKDLEYELWGSMDWNATFQTPTSPAFGQGTIELVQIATPYQSDTTNTTPPKFEQGPHYGVPFMDFGCPYNNHLCTEAAQPYADSDNPGQQLTVGGQIYAISASDSSVYTDFIMYLPPGTDTQWVPLASFNWNTNGKATLPSSGQWSDYVTQHGSDAAETIDSTAKTITPSTTTPFSPGNSFPHWMQAF